MNTKGNILIVDDSRQVLLLINNILKEEGFTTFPADSGEMAFDIIENSKPDLILLDVMMPEIDGFEVCRKIKSNPRFADIPVIFLTALAKINDRLKGFELGGVDYITKPFEKEELLARVKTHIELFSLKNSLKEKNEEYLIKNEEYKELNIKLNYANIQLKKSELLFHTLAQNSPVGIFRTNTEGKTIYVNPKYCELTGLTYEETLGYGWQKVMFPENAEELSLKWENNLSQRNSSGSEFRIIRPDGKLLWVTGNAVPEWLSNEFIGYIGTITDITERKLAEKKIEKIGKHYQTLIEKSPAGIVLINTEGYFIYVSSTARKIFGFTENEEFTGNPSEFTHPDDLPLVLSEIEKILLNPSYIPTIQYRYVDKNGQWLWVESTLRNLYADKDVEAIVINFQDITERKQTEEKIIESEQKFRAIFEQAAVGVALLNTKTGKFLQLNNKYCNFLGYSKEEMLEKTFIDITYPEDVNTNIEYIQKFIDGTIREYSYEKRYVRKDGEIVWGNLTISPLWKENEKPETYIHIAIVEDITERKLAEEKNRESETIFTKMFHKSPVTIMLTYPKEGIILDVNETFLRDMEFTREEVIGKIFVELNIFHDSNDRLKLLELLKVDDSVFGFECRFRSKTGKIMTGILSIVIINLDGKICHLSTIIDITERKKAENELLKAKERIEEHVSNLQIKNEEYESINEELRQTNDELFLSKEIAEDIQKHLTQITNNIPVYIAHIDKDLKIKFFNDLYSDLFRNTTEFVKGKNLEKIVGKEFHEKILPDIQKALNGEKVKFETTFVNRYNQKVTLVTSYLPEFEKDRTSVKGFYVLAYDISEIKQAEEKIRENEEKFRAIAEYSHQAICIVDQKAKITLVNSQMMNLSGYTKEELLNANSFAAFIAPESIEFVISNFTKFVIGEEYQHQYSFYIIRKDGKKRLFEKYMMDFTDTFGIRRLIISMLDVTEKKLAEEEISFQKNELSAIFESSHQIIFLADDDGIIHKINRHGKDFLKKNENEILGCFCGNIINCGNSGYGEGCGKNENCKSCTIRNSIENTYKTGKTILNKEGLLYIEDNNIFNFLISTSLVAQKNSNKVLVTLVDITESKRSEIKIKNANEGLKMLLESSGDLLFVIDLDFNYVEYYGIESNDLILPPNIFIGKNIYEIGLPIELSDNFVKIFNKCLNIKQKLHSEYFLITPIGKQWFELVVNPIFDQNNIIINFFCIVNNISERKINENRILEHEKQFRNLFQNAAIGFSMTGLDGKLNINRAFSEMIGYSEDELNAMNWKDITYPDDIQETEKNMQDLKSGKLDKIYFQKRYIHKNGNIFFAEISATLEKDNAGNPKYFITSIVDVTERKKAEILLRESRELLIYAFNKSPLMMTLSDLTTGKYIEVNDSFCNVSEFTREEIIGKSAIELGWISKDERMRMMQKVQNDEWMNGMELALRTKNGKNIIGKYWGTIIHTTQGEMLYSTSEEITERKKAEIKLIENEHFLNTIIQGSAISMWISDNKGTSIEANESCLKLFGARREEIVGKYNLFKDNIIQEKGLIQQVENVFTKAEIADFIIEYDFSKVNHVNVQNATYYILRSIITPVINSNSEVVNAIIQTIDITEQVLQSEQLQLLNNELKMQYNEIEAVNEELTQINQQLFEAKNRAEESDKLKSSFLANMSHEIRTPMNAILGFSGLLDRQDITEQKRKDYISRIATAGEHLLTIIDDIIDIAKIEANQLKICYNICSVNAILIDIYQIFSRNKILLSKQNIKFILNSDQFVENLKITTDIIRFNQIFINLINNAIKFTNKGFIEFGYSLTNSENESVATFYVKDTGIGIPTEKFEKLFKPFSQIENGIQTSGNGLGLSIIKGLVNLLDGKIWLESELNKGTTFYFSLPVFLSKPEISVKTKEIKTKEMLNLSEYLIYIAEDDIDAYDFFVEILSETKAKIVRAINGNELLSLISQQIPDLILMDINMPEKNGYEALIEIRKQNINIPIIAQTAYALKTEKEQCLNAGFNDYISKPISQEELLMAIKSNLKIQKDSISI